MTTVRFIVLWCDADDCQEESDAGRSAIEARELAAVAGWTTKRSQDYCPAHKPEKRSRQ